MSTTAAKENADREKTSNLLLIRNEVKDLFAYRPVVYWSDLLASTAVAWAALILAVRRENDVVSAGLILLSSLAFLRAVLFIHELSHFRRCVMRGFTLIWNLIVGVPMLLPSFMYVGTHTDHHKRTLYGTIRDPEYFPLARLKRWRTVFFVLEMPVVPILLVVRFGLLTPLSWLIPPLRKLVVERLSALVINPAYIRRAPKGKDRTTWVLLEVLILAWIGFIGFCVYAGYLPLRSVFVWYFVATGVALINQFRTLAAHGYTNDGRQLTTEEQLLDSVNVRGVPVLTELVFPVGLKYHALHHFLPDMPYHALGVAHRRLMKSLPDDAPYRKTEQPGMGVVVARLWARAKTGGGFPERWSRDD